MCFDETPQDVKLFIKVTNDVVLFQAFGCRTSMFGIMYADRDGIFQTQTGQVAHGLGLGCREKQGLAGFWEVGEKR